MSNDMSSATTPPDLDALGRQLRERGVRFLFTQFADLHGAVKGKLVPLPQLRSVVRSGAGFAGLSVPGFVLPRFGDRSEYYGRGDVRTVQALPWRPDVARIVCDGFVAGEPYAGCPRQVLRAAVQTLAQQGYTLQVGIEPEFFLFDGAGRASGRCDPVDAADTLDKPSYGYQTLMREPVARFLARLHESLDTLGFEVLQIDHEDAPGQYELNYTYADALTAADRFMLFKMAAGSLAEAEGLAFSLMPKPFADRPGSGLHFHLSITDSAGRNVFDDGTGGLSTLGQQALAGLLVHAPALAALQAPTVNSYKRLFAAPSRSGSTWAPTQIAWGPNNRTTLARTVGNRIEWRLPDGSCNIYVALAAAIAAMADGWHQQRALPPAADADLHKAAGELATLPTSLGEALQALQQDAAITAAIGPDFISAFVWNKEQEWVAYQTHVGDWERERYAFVF
jgi:glutamine synthetase